MAWEDHHWLWFRRIGSAVFYGICSLLLMTVNKSILTSYSFPSFQTLGFGQILTTVIVIGTANIFKPDVVPDFNKHVAKKIAPLSFVFIGNLFCGLGGTKMVNLPMFTVLRRFSILFTMIGEYLLLGVRPTCAVQSCVYAMIGGTIVAAANDLSFNAVGYSLILMNDLFTAANAVLMKKVLKSKEIGEYGLMFYNSAFMLVPSFIYILYTGEFHKALNYSGWSNGAFVVQFLLSCLMGFVINYSVVLCTMYNSALTTTVIGALKNILTVYIGMSVGGDYMFDWVNFVGLNISVVGSIFYSYVVFFEADTKRHSGTSNV